MPWYLWIILLFAALFYLGFLKDGAKKNRLFKKYQDPVLVERIVKGKYWEGQTSEQLVDAIGKPVAISTQTSKTKTKETWKYHKFGNTYKLKVYLENDVVTKRDKK